MNLLDPIVRLFSAGQEKRNELDPLNDLYYDPQSGMVYSKDAVATSPEGAFREATVFACIRILSDGIAQMDFELYNEDKDGNKELAKGNPLYTLLKHKPCTWMSGYDYWKWNMINLCLRGFFLSKKVYSNGKIVSLIPYHPDYTKFIQASDGTYIFESVSVQNVTNKNFGAVERFIQNDAYYCMYATLDGFNPVSPITYASETIGVAKKMRRHGNKFFDNVAVPPGVLTTPERLDDKAFKRLRESWQSSYSGKNTGKVAILEEGTKFEAISMTNEDAQYLETRGYTREEIAAIFGVPPYMVGDTKQAKGWSTIEAQSSDLLRWTFNPWIKRIEDATDMHLIPRARWGIVYARFKTFELTRGNMEDRESFYVSGIQNGYLSPNEVRYMEGMNKRDGGDEYLTPMNMNSSNDDKDDDQDDEETDVDGGDITEEEENTDEQDMD